MFMLSLRGWTFTIYNGGKLILIRMNEKITLIILSFDHDELINQ